MERQEDEKLWDLLGRSRQPEISPFFARNVVRAARSQSTTIGAIRRWFGFKALLPAAGVAVAVLVLVLNHGPSMTERRSADEYDPVAKVDPQDYEVVADLDELLASDESTLWDENSSL